MRTVMTKCLIDPQTYQRLTNVDSDSEYANFMIESKEKYEDALRSLPNLEPPTEFQGTGVRSQEVRKGTLLNSGKRLENSKQWRE